jgi:virginiamycin B lyase
MEGIAYGPDGNIWFTDTDLNKIGRMTLDGKVTEFDVPTPDSLPAGIIAGPDGNIWFTEVSGGKIGRITPNGVIREFTLPSRANGHSTPVALVVGPDGNLWFSDHDALGRITTKGDIKTWPILAGLQISVYKDVAAGPGKAIWFTGYVNAGQNTILGKLGQIMPDGTIRYFTLPTENTHATTITSGPDGNLWFAEIDATDKYEKVGRITPAGEITEYPVPTDSTSDTLRMPTGITFATDGTLWFIDGFTNQVWHLT